MTLDKLIKESNSGANIDEEIKMVKYIKSRIAIDDSENTHKKLKDIPRGEKFSCFGHEWIILEHDKTGRTLVLTKDIIGEMQFDKNNSNNWTKSTIREYLNGKFLEEMCGKSSAFSQGFRSFTTYLTADDGLKDYGESIDMVSLLTCDLYRKHRDILEPIDEWWWLATPHSTLAANSCDVCNVNTGGALCRCSACSACRGARPLCYLSSEIFV